MLVVTFKFVPEEGNFKRILLSYIRPIWIILVCFIEFQAVFRHVFMFCCYSIMDQSLKIGRELSF